MKDLIQYFPWWLTQIFACFVVFTAQLINRKWGLQLGTYLYYCFIAICFTGWLYPLSFSSAPSFLQVWFIGLASLTLYGFLGSVIFSEPILLWHILGVILVVAGGVLLVIK